MEQLKVKSARASSRGWGMRSADVSDAVELKGNLDGMLRPWGLITSPLSGPDKEGEKMCIDPLKRLKDSIWRSSVLKYAGR